MAYWRQPFADYRGDSWLEQQLEQEEPAMGQAYDDGYAFGKAFASLFVTRGTEMSKIIAVAQKFGKWEGYRELESGMEYIRGFADGVYSAQPKQIATETKEDAK